MKPQTVQELLNIGLTTEQMAVVIRLIAEELEPLERIRASARHRQKVSRDKAVTANVTAGEGQKVSHTLPKVLSLEVVNNPPTVPPSDDHPRFAEFWDAYPARDGSNARKPASKAFSAACKRTDPQAIIDGLHHFVDAMTARGNIGTPFIPQARTWLNQERWNETYGLPAPSSKPSIADGFAKVRAVIAEVERREAEAGGTGSEEDAFGLPRLRQIGS